MVQNFTKWLGILFALVLSAGAAPAHAGIIVYADIFGNVADFEPRGIGGTVPYYDFEDVPVCHDSSCGNVGFYYPGNPWTTHGVTYTNPAPYPYAGANLVAGTGVYGIPSNFFPNNLFMSDWLSPVSGDLDPGVYLFGFDLAFVDVNYDPGPPESFVKQPVAITIFTTAGSYDNLALFGSAALDILNWVEGSNFFGFESTDGEFITGFRIDVLPGTDSRGDANPILGSPGIDNVALGQVAAVPEPGALALLAVGLAALGMRRRRAARA